MEIHLGWYMAQHVSTCAYLLSCLWVFATPWTIAWEASLSTGFLRKEYWSRWSLPSKRASLSRDQSHISCIAGGFFTTEPPGKGACINSLIVEHHFIVWIYNKEYSHLLVENLPCVMLLWIKSYIHFCTGFCIHISLLFWDKYQRIKLQDCIVFACLVFFFYKTNKLFPGVDILFYIPFSNSWVI